MPVGRRCGFIRWAREAEWHLWTLKEDLRRRATRKLFDASAGPRSSHAGCRPLQTIQTSSTLQYRCGTIIATDAELQNEGLPRMGQGCSRSAPDADGWQDKSDQWKEWLLRMLSGWERTCHPFHLECAGGGPIDPYLPGGSTDLDRGCSGTSG